MIDSNPSLLTAGKISAELQCSALGIVLQESSGLLKKVQRTRVENNYKPKKTTFSDPRLKGLLFCMLKERRLLERRVYTVLPVHGDKASCVTRSNGLKLQEERFRLAVGKNLVKVAVLMLWSRFASGAGRITLTEGFNSG